MTLPINIKDRDTGRAARVSKYGQLITAPLQYSTPAAKTLDAINTAFNFIPPALGTSIVITDIIVSADKNVSATTPADVQIYETSAVDSIDVETLIIAPQIVRSSNFAMAGLNLIVGEGLWVNAKTADASVLVTLMFYRVPVRSI